MNFKSILECCMEKISGFISSESLLDFRKENCFVRKRELSLYQVCLYLLYSTRASMFQNLSSIRDNLLKLDFPKVSKQALSKARQGILPTLFQQLYKITTETFYSSISIRKDWHGYKIFAIDGSRVELGNSESNFKNYGKMSDPKNPFRIYSGALGSILYDVLEDVIVDASLHNFLYSERTAALAHLSRLKLLNSDKNAVVIFDRGYFSEEMYKYFLDHNIFCLFRLKENSILSKNCNGDTITYTSGNRKKGIPSMKVRVVSVLLDSGVTEYLATNIMDESITPAMFKDLYFRRWKIESKYYEIKEHLQMEAFNGITSTSVEQEFYITMMYSNLSAFVKAEADVEIAKNTNRNNKYKYQANRIFIIGRIRTLLPKIILNCPPVNWLLDLFEDAARNKSQIQPGRRDTRQRRRPNKRTHFANRKTTT